jgi:hypothetical protein
MPRQTLFELPGSKIHGHPLGTDVKLPPSKIERFAHLDRSEYMPHSRMS